MVGVCAKIKGLMEVHQTVQLTLCSQTDVDPVVCVPIELLFFNLPQPV